jgi:large subunit ribosomal protein L4
MDGQEVGTMELSDEIFAAPVKENLVHQAVVLHLANMRQGTQKAKTRSEVSGGGIKPWRQKGTGHARQGSIRAPQWRHGGVVFAPVPRDYSFKMNRKEKRAALKSVLTSKLQENNLIVVDSIAFDDIKTKNMVRVMKALKAEKAYVVLNGADRNVFLSTRNLPNVRLSQAGTLSVYDILKYEKLVLTQDAVRTIEEVFA